MYHQRKEFRTFPEYCEAAGPWGLATKFETIKKLCADDADATRLIREVTTTPGVRTDLEEGNLAAISSKVKDQPKKRKTQQGTTKAYTLDRLHREAPELYEQVKAGDKTANAAAVEAGFRPKTITVPLDVERAARTLRKHFSAEEVAALKRELGAEVSGPLTAWASLDAIPTSAGGPLPARSPSATGPSGSEAGSPPTLSLSVETRPRFPPGAAEAPPVGAAPARPSPPPSRSSAATDAESRSVAQAYQVAAEPVQAEWKPMKAGLPQVPPR